MTEEQWTADDAQCEVIRENMRSFNERNTEGKSKMIEASEGKQAGMSINVTLPNEVYDWLKAYAEECGVSISAMVRSLIVAYRQDIENGEDGQ